MSTPRRNSKFEWQSAFIESGLTGNAGFIGLLMSTFDNGDGDGFFLSAATISKMTGLNEKTARTQVTKLTRAGWLKRTSRGGNQGGTSRASTYVLAHPEKPQPATVLAQPGHPASQPGASAQVVDHVLIDQVSIDLGSLKDGDELPDGIVAGLDWEYQKNFSPFDADDGMQRYEAPSVEPVIASDSRPEWMQRQRYEQELREEGLNEYGQPLPKGPRTPRSRGSR